MRRYTITVNDQPIVVDVEAVGADLFRVQLDGRLIDVTLEDHVDLAHSPVTPALTTTTSSSSAPASVQRPSAPTAAPRASSTPVAGGASGTTRNKLIAPMPGVVLAIETAPGAVVSRGDVLLKLEAMKMVNELRSPRDGVVAEIYVDTGASVKYGETLIRFEDAR